MRFEVADAGFPMPQQVHDLQPGRVAKGL